MSVPIQVALLGFSSIERNALAAYFRQAPRRSPAYQHVLAIDDARFVVADADESGVPDLLEALGRTQDAVFIGAHRPQHAAVWMTRPIDPAQVLRELDNLLALRDTPASLPVPPSGHTAHQAQAGTPESNPASTAASTPASTSASTSASTLASTKASTPASTPGSTPALAAASASASALDSTPALAPSSVPASLLERALLERRDHEAWPQTRGVHHEPMPGPLAAESLAEALARRARHEAALRPVTVRRALLVDPSEAALALLERQLQRHRIQVDWAVTSGKAIELMSRCTYGMVFLELDLGEHSNLDGLGLCQHIKRRHVHPNGRAPMVALVSARNEAVDRVRGTLAGADGQLGKPLDIAALDRLLLTHGLGVPDANPPSR